MSIRTIGFRLTNVSSSTLFLSDVPDARLVNAWRKPGPMYVPPGATVELIYTGGVALSYERGAIRGFIDQGLLQGEFIQGSDVLGNTQLIYSPNGTAEGNVYTDFLELYSAFQETPGFIEIYMDFPNGNPPHAILPPEYRSFPIPAQVYDFEKRAVFRGNFSTVLAVIEPDPGTQFFNLQGLQGAVAVFNTTPDPLIFISDEAPFAPQVFYIRDGASVVSAPGAAPVILAAHPTGSPVTQSVLGIYNGNLNNPFGAPSIAIAPNGFLILASLINAVVEPGAIEGDASTFLIAFVATASVGLDLANQPDFLGTLILDLQQTSNQLLYVPTDLADWSGVDPENVRAALDRIAAQVGPVA